VYTFVTCLKFFTARKKQGPVPLLRQSVQEGEEFPVARHADS